MANPKPSIKQNAAFLGFVLLGLSVVVAGSVWVAVTFRSIMHENAGRRVLRSRLQEAKSNGISTDIESVIASYQPAEQYENFDRWRVAIKRIESSEFKKSTRGVWLYDWVEPDAPFEQSGEWHYEPTSKRFVGWHRKLIDELNALSHDDDLLHILAAIGSAREGKNFIDVKQIGRLLTNDCAIAMREGNHDRMYADLLSLLNLSSNCLSEKNVISFGTAAIVYSLSLDTYAFNMLRAGVESRFFSSDELNELLPMLQDRSAIKEQWKHRIRWLRANSVKYFYEPRPYMVGMKTNDMNRVLPPRGWDCVHYLDLMDRAESIDVSSLDTLLYGARKLETEIGATKLPKWSSSFDDFAMTRYLAGDLDAQAINLVHSLTSYRLAATAIQLELHTRATSKLPAGLDELQLPADFLPPDNQCFGYRIDEDGDANLWGTNAETLHIDLAPPTSTKPAKEQTSVVWIWTIKSPSILSTPGN